MVYDSARGEIVLFIRHGTTWTWQDGVWTELHPSTSPSTRGGEGIVFDAARGEVVLFRGYDGRYRGNTWTWDGLTWTRRHPATAPDPRTE